MNRSLLHGRVCVMNCSILHGRVCVIIIIIIIIMSLFYEDNKFSTSTNLTYGPRWKTNDRSILHGRV